MREPVNVNDRREGTEAAPGSVQRIVVDLEAIDRKLAHASGEAGGIAEIDEARTLLRTAIEALARTVPVDAGEDTGAVKRRVKIKAESEIAAPSDATVEKPAAKAVASAGKSSARGARAQESARGGRRQVPTEKTANGSLLARLGAAATEAGTEAASAQPAVAETGKPPNTNPLLESTADRLAQLEAEIADLTEAVTSAPTRRPAPEPAADAAPATLPSSDVPEAKPTALSSDSGPEEDDEEAEITIVGANGGSAEPVGNAARHAPRIFREGPPAQEEEEAEVVIRGSSAAPSGSRGTERQGTVRVSARPGASKGAALGKWRIFRGS